MADNLDNFDMQTSTAVNMDMALFKAAAMGAKPVLFRMHSRVYGICPKDTAFRRGVPIDPTGLESHLICEDGRKIVVNGDWA